MTEQDRQQVGLLRTGENMTLEQLAYAILNLPGEQRKLPAKFIEAYDEGNAGHEVMLGFAAEDLYRDEEDGGCGEPFIKKGEPFLE